MSLPAAHSATGLSVVTLALEPHRCFLLLTLGALVLLTVLPHAPVLQAAGPIVTDVSPRSGSVAGGTTITITGSGFDPTATATTIYVGGYVATSVGCMSTVQCKARTLPH